MTLCPGSPGPVVVFPEPLQTPSIPFYFDEWEGQFFSSDARTEGGDDGADDNECLLSMSSVPGNMLGVSDGLVHSSPFIFFPFLLMSSLKPREVKPHAPGHTVGKQQNKWAGYYL